MLTRTAQDAPDRVRHPGPPRRAGVHCQHFCAARGLSHGMLPASARHCVPKHTHTHTHTQTHKHTYSLPPSLSQELYSILLKASTAKILSL